MLFLLKLNEPGSQSGTYVAGNCHKSHHEDFGSMDRNIDSPSNGSCIKKSRI